ncbi:MAG: Flagellar motor protein MotD [Rhodocyclales bacterium]|nr:Flagellar motor protein MotD [Rhodocyclales bacterium]MDB5887355.1 Flagellar motor protein MotD [Rhodocyclales bacterium]
MARRRHEEEHENHERWLVSYADFITLLFAFFVVMYAVSSVNEGKYRVLSDSLVNAFRSAANVEGASIVSPPRDNGSPVPVIIARAPKPDPQAEAQRTKQRVKMRNMADEIRKVLEPLVKGGQVRVNEGVHGISVEINASVLFAPGGAQLGPPAVRALQAVAEVVAPADFPVTIEGHTDNVPISTPNFPSNWELSAVRASSVVRLFVGSGVDPRRLTAAGYGDQRPIADNSVVEGRARNRRVTILIESMLPEVASASTPVRVSTAEGALGTPEDQPLQMPASPSAGK